MKSMSGPAIILVTSLITAFLAQAVANADVLQQQEEHFQRGIDYQEQGKLDKAIEEYTLVIEADPQSGMAAVAYHLRGVVYHWQGNLPMALADCTKAIEIDPEYDSAYDTRAGIYYELGRYRESIADCTMAVKLNPDRIDAYGARGFVFMEMGNYQEAIADFNRMLKVAPADDRPTLYVMRGGAYFKLGDNTQAIADFTAAIKEDPEYAPGYLHLGEVYHSVKDYQHAVDDFKRAVELDPEGKTGKSAREALEQIAEELRAKLKKPEEKGLLEGPETAEQPKEEEPKANITQEDLQRIDRLEKEWASNLDTAGKSIARQDFSAAGKSLDKAMNAVKASKKLLTDKGLDLNKVPRFDAMEMLTVVFANLSDITRLGRNPKEAIMHLNKIKQLAVQSYEYLNEAQAIFRDTGATGLAEFCMQLKNELEKAFDQIEIETGQKIR